MAGDRTIFMLHGAGTILIAVGTISLMTALFTDYWIVSSVGRTGFQNAGLWKACFIEYTVNTNRQNPLGLSGCYSYTDSHFDDYQSWIHPSWLKASKGMLVTSMFLNVISLFCCAFYLMLQKGVYMMPVVFLDWLSCILLSAGTTIFRYMSYDRDWLPLPDSNQLSSSYVAASTAVFLVFIASILHSVQAGFLRSNRMQSMGRKY